MNNPWLKKNPFLSMWLSAANAVIGSARGHTNHQLAATRRRAVKQVADFWTGGVAVPRKRKRRSR